MGDLKLEAAKAAFALIEPGQVVGLGAGSTVAHLVDLIAGDEGLAESVTLVSSSFKTGAYIRQRGLRQSTVAMLGRADLYFDGCDQLDHGLNALKSGGGIHTAEKILASMAGRFVLMGDEGKLVPALDHTFPLVVELLPQAERIVLAKLAACYPGAVIGLRTGSGKDGAVMSDNGNLLADILFDGTPDWREVNVRVKMIPGVVEHSLFFGMATTAFIAGRGCSYLDVCSLIGFLIDDLAVIGG